MHDDATETATPARRSPGWGWAVVLIGLGMGVGLVAGVVLTVGVAATYSLFAPTPVPARGDWVQVFDELNEMRRQINRLNEERKLKDQENVDAIRQALNSVASTASRPADGATPTASAPVAAKPPVRRSTDPLAELDEEIRRLEDTQKVLNTILDMFSFRNQPEPKSRPEAKGAAK